MEQSHLKTEKNKKKAEENKKRRNFWPMSPVTRIKESKKKYNRKKDTKTLGQYLKEKSDVE